MSEALEEEIRAFCQAGEHDRAATAALEGYGRELLGFLIATMRNETDASEVFSQMSEDMWLGLPRFEWRCTCRAWLYRLARNAGSRFWRTPHNQRKRRVPLSQISEVVDKVRTRTLPHLRTEVKDRLAELRESLDPDDQALLILRVNRKLSWKDVARVMGEVDDGDEAALDRAAAALRQRFKSLKSRLRDAADKHGLLEAGDEPPPR